MQDVKDDSWGIYRQGVGSVNGYISQTDLSNKLSQSGVTEQQPASGSDAIGFVLELLWFKFAEITESVGEK